MSGVAKLQVIQFGGGQSGRNPGFWSTLKFSLPSIGLKGAYGRWQSGSVSNHGFLDHVELGHCGKCNYSLKRVGEIYITI